MISAFPTKCPICLSGGGVGTGRTRGRTEEWRRPGRTQMAVTVAGFQVEHLPNRRNCNEKIDVTVQVDS